MLFVILKTLLMNKYSLQSLKKIEVFVFKLQDR